MTKASEIDRDSIALKAYGRVVIRDQQTGEVLVEQNNAINYSTMAQALALGLADRSNGHIQSMVFGNGASVTTSTGDIQYFPPNTNGLDAALYNQTYSKVVDDMSPLNENTAENYLTVNYTQNLLYADVVVTCTLDLNEPTGQDAFDDAASDQETYVFDEIGLMTYDATTNGGVLLCHVIFNPVQKSLNRAIEVIYTIRIVMA